MIRSLHAFLFLLLTSTVTHAQVDKVFIKGEYNEKPLIEIIHEIEQQQGVQFVYLNDVIKDIVVTGVFRSNTHVLEALETMVRNKPISFASHEKGQIVIYANPNKTIREVKTYYNLSGTVRDKNTQAPLPFVNVYIPSLSKGVITDDNGKFEIKTLGAGPIMVEFRYVGYDLLAQKVSITNNTTISIELQENSLELKEIIITPSVFEISTVETSPVTLNKEEILHSPNMGKDIYRTLRALPGIANNDFSSKARIRGGHSDETGVYLDNLLINDPFHLEEVDGSFSIFNTDYIDELTVLTGGFSAKYTDRLSGILDVKTSDRIEANKYTVSADFLNLSMLVQQKINNKVGFFFTGRRGYLDFLLRDMETEDSQVLPRFSDFWSKVTYQANSKNSFTMNFLMGRDNFNLADREYAGPLSLKNIRNNINTWVNWKWFPTSTINSVTTFAYQFQKKDAVFRFSDDLASDNYDNNKTTSLVLTNTSYWDVSEKSTVEMGVEWKQFFSAYDYDETRYDVFNSQPDSIILTNVDFNSDFKGYTAAAYLQYSLKLTDKFTIQPGVRALSQSYTTGVKFAPRLAMSYVLSPSLIAKVAYGIYYQPDLYFKLRTSLGQYKPYNTNSKAIHYTGSLTYSNHKTNVIVNGYYKDYTSLQDDYRFEFFNRLGGVNILDVPFNTASATSSGFEIMVRQNYGKKSMLSVSYAYSKSQITSADGRKTARDFDQPHVIIVNNIFRLPRNWNISTLWSYHTGYPYTPTNISFIKPREGNADGRFSTFYFAGPKNSERLPASHSLDFRMEKSWYVRKHAITVYLNIVNLYNQKNIRSYLWQPYTNRLGNLEFEHSAQENIPRFISPGVSFTFY